MWRWERLTQIENLKDRKLEGAKNEVRGMKTVLIERFDRWFIDHTPFLVTNS
jgi:hypothetical protein